MIQPSTVLVGKLVPEQSWFQRNTALILLTIVAMYQYPQ
jgi:hypothetical protein